MNKVLSLLFVFFIIGCKNSSSTNVESITLKTTQQQISLSETEHILYTLAADSMKGRDTKSGGYFKAAEFVSSYFKTHNVNPFYPDYRDSFVLDSLVSFNLVGQIGEFDPEKNTILIGAHLDHIGIKHNENDSIFNGANDNAAGATAVLQLSRFLASYTWDQNILLALFAEEEKGLKGSHHLAQRFIDENISLDYMVNFEMIGTKLTTGPNQVYLTGFNQSNMADEMNAIAPNFVQFLPEAKELNLFRRSDNYAFFLKMNIPAQTLSTFDFKNFDFYHKAGDEASKLDLENLNQIISTAAYTISQLIHQKTAIQLYPENQ